MSKDIGKIKTFVRSSGEGDNIVCLHSCLGSSKQWQGLMNRLKNSFCVSAIDLYGYGKGPQWNLNKPISLQDEVKLVAAMMDDMKGPVHLVGHSYGAAVALKVAEHHAHRIQSITMYEPVLFTLLFAAGQTHRPASEIFSVVKDMQRDYQAGDSASATRRFIDYWSGIGTWNQFSPEQQASMSTKAGMVLSNFEALLSERNLFKSLSDLNLPTLCLYGKDSPLTTVAIAKILGELMPNIDVRPMSAMGHMGPITHSNTVNDEIETFLRSQEQNTREAAYSRAA